MTLQHSPWRTVGKSRSTEKGVLHTILVPVDRSDLSEGTSRGCHCSVRCGINERTLQSAKARIGSKVLYGYVRKFLRSHGEILVGERGFEPPTPWSRTRCSTRLSHLPASNSSVSGLVYAAPAVAATSPFRVHWD